MHFYRDGILPPLTTLGRVRVSAELLPSSHSTSHPTESPARLDVSATGAFANLPFMTTASRAAVTFTAAGIFLK